MYEPVESMAVERSNTYSINTERNLDIFVFPCLYLIIFNTELKKISVWGSVLLLLDARSSSLRLLNVSIHLS